MALPNIPKLQKLNQQSILSKINALTPNTAVARGEDLDSDSLIEDILYNWANDIIGLIHQSVIDKGFNEAGTLDKAEPHVIDKAGVIKVLQLAMPDHWIWAEYGRRKGKRPPVSAIENWITYRGIDVSKVRKWKTKEKDYFNTYTDRTGSEYKVLVQGGLKRVYKKGKAHFVMPYKKITDTLKLRRIMAFAIAQSIGKRGTIKRFGYKGSKFLSSVLNEKSLNQLSYDLAAALGYEVSISLAKEF